MSNTFASLAPLMGLVGLMALLVWGLKWARQRLVPPLDGPGSKMRVISALAVGPQQRVVVVEMQDAGVPVRVALGVTPQHISHLITLGPVKPGADDLSAASTAGSKAGYAAVAQALAAGQPATQDKTP